MANLNDMAAADMAAVIMTEDSGRVSVTYAAQSGSPSAFSIYALEHNRSKRRAFGEGSTHDESLAMFLFDKAALDAALGRSPANGDTVTFDSIAFAVVEVSPSEYGYSLTGQRLQAVKDFAGDNPLRERL